MKKVILIIMLILLSFSINAITLNPIANLETVYNSWLGGTRDWITSLNQTGKQGIITNLTIINLNVTGIDRNATFQGDVKIIGTLYGGSPIKIAGINLTSGSLWLPSGRELNDSVLTSIVEIGNLSDVNTSITNLNNLPYYIQGVDFGLVNLSKMGNLDINTSGSLNVSGASRFNSVYALSYDVGWTNLSNYPVACPAGNIFITQLDDSIICTTLSTTSFFGNANFTTQYDNRADRFLNSNWTTLYNNEASVRFSNSNFTTQYNNRINNSDMIIINLNVSTINGTSLSLFNRSINSITIQENQITNLQSYLLSTSTFFNSFWNVINLTNFIGMPNASIIGTQNLSLIKVGNATWSSNVSQMSWNNLVSVPAGFADNVDDTGAGESSAPYWNRGNTTDYLGGTNATINKSISLEDYFKPVQNATAQLKLAGLNVTGAVGFNATIWLGNGSIQYNGSNICLGPC